MLEVYPEIYKDALIPAFIPMKGSCQNWIVYIINAMTVGYVNTERDTGCKQWML